MSAKINPGAGATARGAEEGCDDVPSLAPNQQHVKPAAPVVGAHNHELRMTDMQKPQLAPGLEVDPTTEPDVPISIAKPAGDFDINKFKSKRDPSLAGVATLLTALPVHKLSDAKDFIRLHPDEANYWSMELCVVSVPVKGQRRDTLHLIEEELALQYLQPASIRRYRLALGANPEWRLLLVHCPQPKPRQRLERRQPEGLRGSEDQMDEALLSEGRRCRRVHN